MTGFNMNENKIALLQVLGILDGLGEITPEAYIGYINRLPLNRQAEAMGIPLFLLPPPNKCDDPESKVSRFFSKDKELVVDSGFEESYLVKSFIGSIAGGFEVRKRKHSLKKSDIEQISKRISSYSEGDVVFMLEKYNEVFHPHFGFVYSIKFPKEFNGTKITYEDLFSRFKSTTYYKLDNAPINDQEGALIEAKGFLKSKRRANQYASNMMQYIILWRSLTPSKWADLVRTVLENWDKMYSGWPDINIVSSDVGLLFVEVKGKDKLHTSQIFTLLKLREILGANMVAIAWSNRVAYELPFDNQEHQRDIRGWLYLDEMEREKVNFHPLFFYDKNKSLFSSERHT